MKKWVKISSYATFGTGGPALFMWIFNLIAYRLFQPLIRGDVPPQSFHDTLALVVAAGFVILLLFHITGFVTTFIHMRYFGREAIRSAVLATGVVSFMTLFADIGLLHDIITESALGLEVAGEVVMLCLSMIPQVIFFGLMFPVAVRGLHAVRAGVEPDRNVRDDTIFYAVQYTGLLCGATGIFIAGMMFIVPTALWNLRLIVVYYNAFILAPYVLVAAYWLFMNRGSRIADWCDEKQRHDISRVGFTALLVTLPVMALVYTMNYMAPRSALSVLWFPLYIHLVLSSFSGSALYLKRA